jgi:hypothetical protein
LSVITPFDVERIATQAVHTRGHRTSIAYCLKPGVLILSSFVIADSLVSGLYFQSDLDMPWLVVISSKLVIQDIPLSKRTFVISFFRFEAGFPLRGGSPLSRSVTGLSSLLWISHLFSPFIKKASPRFKTGLQRYRTIFNFPNCYRGSSRKRGETLDTQRTNM